MAAILPHRAVQDQYLLEAGVSHPISKVKGLTLTFGPRWEGVPARDMIGNDLGFRGKQARNS